MLAYFLFTMHGGFDFVLNACAVSHIVFEVSENLIWHLCCERARARSPEPPARCVIVSIFGVFSRAFCFLDSSHVRFFCRPRQLSNYMHAFSFFLLSDMFSHFF